MENNQILIAKENNDVLNKEIIKKIGFTSVYMTDYGIISASVVDFLDIGLITIVEIF